MMRPSSLKPPRAYAPHPQERQLDVAWGLGVLLVALLLLTVHLGDLPLRDWDEGTVAQVAREIWRNPQAFWHPTLYGDPYFNKPPLVHGAIALSFALFGEASETAARLPGAIATAFSVLLLYAIGRELWRRRAIAVWSALVYLTWLPVARHGRLAMLDGAVLCFWLLWVWLLLRSRRDLRYALGVGLAASLLGLTKGLVLALLFGALSLGFLAWDTPRLLWSGWFWGGTFLGLLPLLGWYGLQWQEYGATFVQAHVLDQSASRIWDAVERNSGAPWYYVLELLKYGCPWLIFLPAAWRRVWCDRRLSWGKLVLVWSGGYFAAISLMGTKLPWYVLPVYPALAIAVGTVLDGVWQESALTGLPDRPTPAFPRLWLKAFAVLAVASWTGSTLFAKQLLWGAETVDANLVVALLAVAMTLTLALGLAVQRDRQMAIVLMWGWFLSLLLFVTSSQWIWELNEDYPVKPVAELVRDSPPASSVYTSHPHDRPSLNFYAQRPVYSQSLTELRTRWMRDANICLLLDRRALDALSVSQQHYRGWAEGWHLVCRHDRLADAPPEPIKILRRTPALAESLAGGVAKRDPRE